MNHTNHPHSSALPEPQTKPEFIRHGFNQIARRYNLLNDLMTGGLHRRWKHETVRRLRLQPGMRVLDLCAGTGDLALYAVKRIRKSKPHMRREPSSEPVTGDEFELGTVVALDFAWEMMAAGRRRLDIAGSPLQWLCSDASCLPFAENTFDAAMVGFGLRNVISVETALQEVLRVLKPGAAFVSLDTAPAEWKGLNWAYRLHMRLVVPALGALLSSNTTMYSYLTASAEAFETPQQLSGQFTHAGFIETGCAYRPRCFGGAALVWGRKPG